MKRFDGHSVEDIIVATGFALTLLTFVLGDFFTCLRGGNPTQIENRRASEFPTISRNFSNIAAFPKLFERYLEDRMAFKSQLVAARSLIKWKVFGVSASDQVLIGKFGFLFLYAGNNKFLTHGTYTFTEEELWAWQALLEKRSQWCHS